MEHEGDPDIDEPYVPPVGVPLGGPVGDQASPAQPAVADTAEGECGCHREPATLCVDHTVADPALSPLRDGRFRHGTGNPRWGHEATNDGRGEA